MAEAGEIKPPDALTGRLEPLSAPPGSTWMFHTRTTFSRDTRTRMGTARRPLGVEWLSPDLAAWSERLERTDSRLYMAASCRHTHDSPTLIAAISLSRAHS